jgi:hydroxymethylglutaryl-CoA lyase
MILTECPRDAIQGLPYFIATADKVRYLQVLLQAGFDLLDAGSFVSPNAIPQMRDTAAVLSQLDLSDTRTELLVIVANLRGAREAASHEAVRYLGFPLSVSETFQQRNTNKSIAEAWLELAQIQDICINHGKKLLVYLSMGFGNPYEDPYSPEILGLFIQQLEKLGVGFVALADTIGSATPDLIRSVFPPLLQAYPKIELSAHLHSRPQTAHQKIEAVWESGCRRIDCALGGLGGCPMANDDLVGNMPTEVVINFLQTKQIKHSLNFDAVRNAQEILMEIVPIK